MCLSSAFATGERTREKKQRYCVSYGEPTHRQPQDPESNGMFEVNVAVKEVREIGETDCHMVRGVTCK